MLTGLQDVNQNQTTEVSPLEYQVGGHTTEKNSAGMMSMKGGYVLKPILKPNLGKREIEFYESLKNPCDATKALPTFVPKYFGTVDLCSNNKPTKWLVLEDICHGLAEPCVMDIKIGRQTWDPDASSEKMQNERVKYVNSKRDLGFCLPGFQVFDLSTGELRRFGNEFGKSLDGEGVRNALHMFVNGHIEYSRALILELLSKLWQILGWFQTQTTHHFYGSSILLVYDAAKLRDKFRSQQQARNGIYRPTLGRQLSLRTATGPLTPGFDFGRPKSPSTSSLGSRSSTGTPSSYSPYNSVHDWQTLYDLCKTHSLENNYEQDLQNIEKNYEVVLKNLLNDREQSDNWVSVKMIDFAHVFPANGEVDNNYLFGLKNLISVLEEFFQETIPEHVREKSGTQENS